jgi:hypothetical protein
VFLTTLLASPLAPLAIIAPDILRRSSHRGRNALRHCSRTERTPQVDFGDAAARVEIHSSEETVEISIEADFETLLQGSRRFAILNIPRHLFSEATAASARRPKGFRSQKHHRE